jgi:putative flippase GtrA
MNDLSRRPGSGPSRSARERRAYQLVVAGATATVVAIVTFILAVAGVMGYGPFVLALIIAVVCSMLFRRGVSR